MIDKNTAQGHSDRPGKQPGKSGALGHFARISSKIAAERTHKRCDNKPGNRKGQGGQSYLGDGGQAGCFTVATSSNRSKDEKSDSVSQYEYRDALPIWHLCWCFRCA
jgi:hypothetical protein